VRVGDEPRQVRAARRVRRQAGRTAEPDDPRRRPNYQDLGPAFPAWTGTGKDVILQPPKPQIQLSERMLEHVMGHDLDMEAAG
jgi:hypothetical protein